MTNPSQIIIVGTGPAALMAGTVLLEKGFKVSFYEQKKTAGRKFLVAGKGGFNISNSLSKSDFLAMYNQGAIREMVNQFDNNDTVAFLKKIGIETFIGSSGKIFPLENIKPIEVLQSWLKYLEKLGAKFYFEYQLVDFTNNQATFLHNEKHHKVSFDKMILALGGASWSVTGSDGKWLKIFEEKQIPTNEFQSSNAGFEINLPKEFKQFEGSILKNVKAQLGDTAKLGEVRITNYGFEGAPIYYLNKSFRNGNIALKLDAKPSLTLEQIQTILSRAKNATAGLKKLKIPPSIIAFIKMTLSKDDFLDNEYLAHYIKNIPFHIERLRPIEEAISTVGGVSFDAVKNDLSLKLFPDIYCCGEMLDWDAPTGGFLLQACFASGVWVGNEIFK